VVTWAGWSGSDGGLIGASGPPSSRAGHPRKLDRYRPRERASETGKASTRMGKERGGSQRGEASRML
jgi:hypothetical protein